MGPLRSPGKSKVISKPAGRAAWPRPGSPPSFFTTLFPWSSALVVGQRPRSRLADCAAARQPGHSAWRQRSRCRARMPRVWPPRSAATRPCATSRIAALRGSGTTPGTMPGKETLRRGKYNQLLRRADPPLDVYHHCGPVSFSPRGGGRQERERIAKLQINKRGRQHHDPQHDKGDDPIERIEHGQVDQKYLGQPPRTRPARHIAAGALPQNA